MLVKKCLVSLGQNLNALIPKFLKAESVKILSRFFYEYFFSDSWYSTAPILFIP